jgi:integrase
MAISTGMRKGELLNIKWKDIDFEHGFIKLEKTKNSETRDVPINNHLLKALKGLEESRKIGNYIFCYEDGRPRSSSAIQYCFTRACRRAGIQDFHFHDLRHTAASLYASRGCDLVTLQHLLGHKSINMTMRYAHLLPSSHDKVRRIMQDLLGEITDTETDTETLRASEKVS